MGQNFDFRKDPYNIFFYYSIMVCNMNNLFSIWAFSFSNSFSSPRYLSNSSLLHSHPHPLLSLYPPRIWLCHLKNKKQKKHFSSPKWYYRIQLSSKSYLYKHTGNVLDTCKHAHNILNTYSASLPCAKLFCSHHFI